MSLEILDQSLVLCLNTGSDSNNDIVISYQFDKTLLI